MAKEVPLYSKDESLHLLNVLEQILELDPLIDEVGYIHPSQLKTLTEEARINHISADSNQTQSADVVLISRLLETDALVKNAIFWNEDHKLGISTQYLLPLYNVAKHKFMEAFAEYKVCSKSSVANDNAGNENMSNSSVFSETVGEVMKHSKAFLLLSSDFGTVWNARKLIASRKQNISTLQDELVMSSLVLSFAPKSEQAWSHRRWVIKEIAQRCETLQEVIETESAIVEKIAEKSKMNYRAWNHRCWLVSYMSSPLVLHELHKSRNWGALHVADSSCFHYRRKLLNRMLNQLGEEKDLALYASLRELWKDELDWNQMLIRHYIGREALWLHRRFLSVCWIKYFAVDENSMDKHILNFMDHEADLLQYCSTIADSDFDDFQAQAAHCALYFLWLCKLIIGPSKFNLEDKLKAEDLRALLSKVCPEKFKLWDSIYSSCSDAQHKS